MVSWLEGWRNETEQGRVWERHPAASRLQKPSGHLTVDWLKFRGYSARSDSFPPFSLFCPELYGKQRVGEVIWSAAKLRAQVKYHLKRCLRLVEWHTARCIEESHSGQTNSEFIKILSSERTCTVACHVCSRCFSHNLKTSLVPMEENHCVKTWHLQICYCTNLNMHGSQQQHSTLPLQRITEGLKTRLPSLVYQ